LSLITFAGFILDESGHEGLNLIKKCVFVHILEEGLGRALAELPKVTDVFEVLERLVHSELVEVLKSFLTISFLLISLLALPFHFKVTLKFFFNLLYQAHVLLKLGEDLISGSGEHLSHEFSLNAQERETSEGVEFLTRPG